MNFFKFFQNTNHINSSNDDDIDTLVEMVAENEGFRSEPYIDPLVRSNPTAYGIPIDEFIIIDKHFDKLKPTFGHGITRVSEQSSKELLREELLNIYIPELKRNKPIVNRIPPKNRNALYDLAFNLGVPKLLGFKRMWLALENGMLNEAAQEILDSKYARDLPNRAQRNSDLLSS